VVFTYILISLTGYKPAAGKSVDEYRNLDAEDESLARWKASLGLDSAAGGDPTKPIVRLCLDVFARCFHLYFTQLSILCLELTSPSLPEGRSIRLDFSSEERRKYNETNSIQVKEGAPYK
jgi:Rho GDP-dissociation inhibitor